MAIWARRLPVTERTRQAPIRPTNTGPSTHRVRTTPMEPPSTIARMPRRPKPVGVEPTEPRSRFRQLDHQVSISLPLDSGNATKSPTAGTPPPMSDRDPKRIRPRTSAHASTANWVVPVRIAVMKSPPNARLRRPIWPRTNALIRTEPDACPARISPGEMAIFGRSPARRRRTSSIRARFHVHAETMSRTCPNRAVKAAIVISASESNSRSGIVPRSRIRPPVTSTVRS